MRRPGKKIEIVNERILSLFRFSFICLLFFGIDHYSTSLIKSTILFLHLKLSLKATLLYINLMNLMNLFCGKQKHTKI